MVTQSPVAQTTVSEGSLSAEELRKIDAYWSATLYLCAGIISLKRLQRIGEIATPAVRKFSLACMPPTSCGGRIRASGLDIAIRSSMRSGRPKVRR